MPGMDEKPRKPPFQFGLGSLFVLTVISAILISFAVATSQVKRATLHDLLWYGSRTIEDAQTWLAR